MKMLALALVLLRAVAIQDQWEIKIEQVEGLDVLVVVDSTQNELLKFNATSKTSAFKEAEELYFKEFGKSLLVTRWYRGAHSEVIRVFDPTKKDNPLIKEIVTSWPATYNLQKGKLVFLIPFDKHNGAMPQSIKYEWDPFKATN